MEAVHLVRTNVTPFRSSKSDFSLTVSANSNYAIYKILQPITVGDLTVKVTLKCKKLLYEK